MVMTDGILFLGTSGGGEITEKQTLASGGIIIKSDDHQIHIDPGPGALVMAKAFGIDLRKNTILLVSHSHINHVNDLNAVISAMTHTGLYSNGILLASDSVIHGIKNRHSNYVVRPYVTQFHRKALKEVKVMKAEKRCFVDNIEIKAIKAVHSDPTSIGFRILTPNFSVIYSGDTEINKDIIEQYKGADIYILNVQHPPKVKERWNMNFDDVVRIIKKYPPKLLILNHFKAKFLKTDILYLSRSLRTKYGVKVIIAKEGLMINPKTYAADLKQRTLFMYE